MICTHFILFRLFLRIYYFLQTYAFFNVLLTFGKCARVSVKCNFKTKLALFFWSKTRGLFFRIILAYCFKTFCGVQEPWASFHFSFTPQKNLCFTSSLSYDLQETGAYLEAIPVQYFPNKIIRICHFMYFILLLPLLHYTDTFCFCLDYWSELHSYNEPP